MKKIACLMADGFEELELITIVDILRRAEVKIDLVGLDKEEITSCRNIKANSDVIFKDVNFDLYDGIYIPGGSLGAQNLKADSRVIDLVKRFDEEEKMIAAICAGPLVLNEAGILDLTSYTAYPGLEKEFTKGIYEPDALSVTSGHILTSMGPATASIFAFDILNYLGLEEAANKIYEEMLFNKIIQ